MSLALVKEVTGLRAERHHLAAQVEAGVDTKAATLDEAREALARVENDLADAEARARELPEAAHLFGRRRKPGWQRRNHRPQSQGHQPTTEEATMARMSKAAQLDEVKVALRKAEKNAGNTKWALSGKGAEKNPPDAARKKHLKDKLAGEQALVAELRAKRAELQA